MERKYVIIGAGVFAQRLRIYIEQSENNHVVAYAVEKKYIRQTIIKDVEVIPLENLNYRLDCNYLLGIGYKNMGELRKEIYEKCKKKGIAFSNYIHPSAIISTDCKMGEGNVILESTVISPSVKIGNANLIFDGSTVGHDSVIGSYNTICSKVLLSSNNILLDNCFIGDCAYIAPYKTAGEHVLVAANCIVDSDIKSFEILFRNGKRIIGKSVRFFDRFVK